MQTIKSILLYLLVIILSLLAFIGFYIAVVLLANQIYVKEGYLMMTMDMPSILIQISILLVMIFGPVLLLPVMNKSMVPSYQFQWLRDRWQWLLAGLVIIFFLAATNVTVIYPDRMVSFSSVSFGGNTYTYEDVIKVETGVYGASEGLGFIASKGDSYYKITFKDEKTIDLLTTFGENERLDTYEGLVVVDRQLEALGVDKRVAADDFDLLTYDEVYLNRFREIFHLSK